MAKCGYVSLVVSLGMFASLAHGQAIVSFQSGVSGLTYHPVTSGDVVGWRFSVTQDVYVTHLGVWDDAPASGSSGLVASHTVGIWNMATQTLLGPTATVTPSDTHIVNGFHYAAIESESITLHSGHTYVIGALYVFNTIGTSDAFRYAVTDLITSPVVNFIGSSAPIDPDLGFAYPGRSIPLLGYFGPNFLYEPVPAPGAAALLGLAGLVGARRRR